eukprot:TRINITY_DN70299_c0_g1_i1.p1 TRINITY_DN70299_c0_g1~~TRINITY_DN70299_c0_g1_i1.p1  ORF type:complete len:604 (+),score=68.80 TRINITY_DN70299_c0_g1_i1:106-1917(+)
MDEQIVQTENIEKVGLAADRDDADKGSDRHRGGFGQIKVELLLRKRVYLSDWKDGASFKVLAATCYMFFASLAPAITLGTWLLAEVKGEMGLIEVLISSSLCGVIFSVFAGQGMVIVGVTGPVCIFSATVYKLADSFNYPFLPWMGWIAIWACAMHLALALTGSCRFVSLVTRFACETFGSLIGTIYVWTAVADVIRYFEQEPIASALMSLVLCIGTNDLATRLANAKNLNFFNKTVREALASYAVPLSMMIFICLSVVARDTVDVLRIVVNTTFQPTKQRDWIVNIGDCPIDGIFLAILPAVVLTVLFFFDHNVSSLMAQAPEFGLRKPPAYNWDFLIVGLMILICGLFGLPFTNGLIPQAPLHVQALATVSTKTCATDGSVHAHVERVEEQRVSNFVHALAIGLCCTPPVLELMGKIPLAALSGLFLFMGLGCFDGNGFIDRLLLAITEPSKRSVAKYDRLSGLLESTSGSKELGLFTLFQLFLFGVIFGITKTPAAIAFPLLIAALVVVRWLLLPRLFSRETIECIDGVEDNGATERHVQNEADGKETWTGISDSDKDLCGHKKSARPSFVFRHEAQDESEFAERVSIRLRKSLGGINTE